MKKEELYKFVQEFNSMRPLSTATIIEATEKLEEKDLELFMMLANYKNGKDFENKLKKGDI